MKSKLIDPKVQAKWFSRIRAAHQSESTEDYVELIADLIAAQQEARLADLAKRMGLTHATVSKVLLRLKREGYIKSQPYRSIFLTKKGMALAKKSKQRHQIVVEFLVRLGVDPETAKYDAEGIEHHISSKTLNIFKKYKLKS